MHRPSTFVICLLAVWLPAVTDPPAKPSPVTHYNPDPGHLWNRLHAALLTRPDRDGKTVGNDVLDPLVFPTTRRLLEGPTHGEAVKLLDEFLADGHKLVRDPVKRAMMQRDMWAVFDWAAYPFGNYYSNGEPVKIRKGPLQERLARSIRKLAPSRSEANALPDTYTLAVKAKAFPPAFNPVKPNDPFLPPDLFDPAGPWVCVTGPKEMLTPVASEHARVFAGRSVFLVFIKLPEGRKATLAFLNKLNTFPKPWKVPPQEGQGETGRRIPVLNPDVPQFPAGTQVALVRQMVVVTDEGRPVPTRLIESVQFRIYREILLRQDDSVDPAEKAQGFVDLELRRADLFAGKNGGLRATKGNELVSSALTFFRSWSDPYETNEQDTHHRPLRAFHQCAACHTRGGIHGVHSYTQRVAQRPTVALGLFPIGIAEAQTRATEWLTGLKDWAELRKLAGW